MAGSRCRITGYFVRCWFHMITSLTPAQEAALDQWRQEWFDVGRSTERADRERAERAITAMYAEIGRDAPRFLWFSSPAVAILARTLLTDKSGQLGDQLGGQLWDQLRGQLWDQLRGHLNQAFWGAHESYWIAHYAFCRDVLETGHDEVSSRRLDLWAEVARVALWWWPHENYVIVSDRPTICSMVPGRDGRYQLHSTDGPALQFSDGYSLYAVGGVRVPERVVTDPDSVTGSEWAEMPNEEVRRVVIERRGTAVLAELGAEVVDERKDSLGHPVRLWKSDAGVGGAMLTMVELVNSTKEPDGSHRRYWIRVPNQIWRADSAAAWHCGLELADWKKMRVQT